MRKTVELALTMSDVSGVLFERVLAAGIEKAAEPKRVGRQLCTINRELMNSQGNEVLLPKRVSLDATVGSEGVTTVLATPSYDYVAVAVQILESGVEIGRQTLKASKYNLIDDQLDALGLAVAKKEDQDIIREMCDWTALSAAEAVTTSDGVETSFVLSNSCILEIVELLVDAVTTTTGYDLDYRNGTISFSTAPASDAVVTIDYGYCASLDVTTVPTAGVLNLQTILSARNTLESLNYEPDVIIMHPDQNYDLLQFSQVIDASQFGGPDAIRQGKVARIVGLDVYMTQQIPKGVVAVFDSKKCMTYVIKEEISTEIIKEGDFALKGTVGIKATMWCKSGRVNDDAIVVITNAQPDALVV